MTTKQTPPPPEASAEQQQSLLSASAEGAKFLILLQVGSRMLTFVVNQVLLRFLSPELLGISVQLELFMISVLFFSRESLRTALQRHSAEPATKTGGESKRQAVVDPGGGPLLLDGTPAARSQTVVNLSLLTVPLGIVFASVLALFYSRSFASSETAARPYFSCSIVLYVLATLLELVSEPCFALAQQNLLYKLRAGAESAAAFTRCVLTCGVTVYAARVAKVEGGLGPLPFALGQVGYAVVLLGVYWWRCFSIAKTGGFSMGLKGIESSSTPYTLNLFHRPLSLLALSMWLQSFLKHLLTHLDSLLIAVLTSPHDQGIYALAANYGSLLARMLFQPIEEASRNLFAKLLSSAQPAPRDVDSAAHILAMILKLYTLFSLFLLSLAPPLAPVLLQLLLGARWGSGGGEAGSVLSAYCYYIPLLAINGVTEAFVQSVAVERELARQSAWMGLFSALFAGTGWLFLSVLGWGARGLVAANSVGMAMRVVWSWLFIKAYFSRTGDKKKYGGGEGLGTWDLGRVMPSPVLVAAAIGVGAVARGVAGSGAGLVREVGTGGALGVGLAAVCFVTEREFWDQCLQTFRSTRAK